ncbi:hypothetical protein [Mesorhizobium sp. CAU 1732]|uniref:hypothetical protein n=1 Tax=Mesorhizobium sp. CAU 1732 TaxID=3140358 RepID=UPI0032619ED2
MPDGSPGVGDRASPLRNRIEGVGLIAVVIGVGYLAAITLLGQSGFVRGSWTAAIVGPLLTCVFAVSLAAMMIYSQRLNGLGIAPVAQYGLRFPLYVMVALPAAWLGLDGQGSCRKVPVQSRSSHAASSVDRSLRASDGDASSERSSV